MLKKFKDYLDDILPVDFYYQVSSDGKELIIKNENQYVYLFHLQELENTFELCCSLVPTIVELNKEAKYDFKVFN